jgi:simple sugar transport system ATP-binding protein
MQVQLKHISKSFKRVRANDDISVTFHSGRIIGVLGENGAGKSTLMKILSGYQQADSGEIWLEGRHISYHGVQAAIANGIGMLQQDPLDIPAFSVLENFMYGSRFSRRDAREKLTSAASRFGFSLDASAYIESLSIAQRQQLEIVRLLSLGVRLLILDEPTTGISAEQKHLLFDALRALARDEGLTILLVSHKLEDVIALCDEVVVLRAGRLTGAMAMPATAAQLVKLMFDTEVQPRSRKMRRPTSDQIVLALDQVTLRGGRSLVEQFSFTLRAGEVVGMAGLEGSGQGLALRACTGLLRPSRGRVSVSGRDMTGHSYHEFLRAGVAFAAAGRLEEGLVAGLTLTEHFALAAEHQRVINWQSARDLTRIGIEHYQIRGMADSPIETLSGGNQQRVLMALMPPRPAAMVLEQPTRGLDIDSARWIWTKLLARRAQGSAVLFTSAELDEIMEYSDRILVFYAGQVVEVADPARTSVDELGYLIGGKRLAASTAAEAS